MSSKLAKRIVKAVEKEVNNRSGINWDALDKATQKELRKSIEEKIEAVLDRTSPLEFSNGD